MALPATIRRFLISIADSDRDHYSELDLRCAQHPSESERYLVARVLARCVLDSEGLEFGKGVSTADEPALWQHNLRGELQMWVDVGQPSTDRLHKASKACKRVVVFAWQHAQRQLDEAVAAEVFGIDRLEIYSLDAEFMATVAATLDRTNTWSLSIAGGALYLGVGEQTFESSIVKLVPGLA